MAGKKQNPQTHDYTNRTWGHDYAIMSIRNGGHEIDFAGWGLGIKSGDYIIIPHSDGGTTRYQVKEIEYQLDPHDMWFAKTIFAPRPLTPTAPAAGESEVTDGD